METFNQRYLAFTKPFVDSLKDLYSTMMSTELTQGRALYKKQGLGIQTDYTSIMGITGRYKNGDKTVDFRGNLILSWPMPTYLKSAGAMMMEEFTHFSDDVADVGMEVCNITMGGAKASLTQVGFFIEMSIPTSVYGNNLELNAQASATTIIVPMSSKLGNFYLELNYEEPLL
ncbi:MAG: chemotaxis protein CheX [Gammaproteobacteria bacterium]|nr:chemotaxis protein CheX [Gammaproteobacteria bacterium]